MAGLEPMVIVGEVQKIFFCAVWNCETTRNVYWKPQRDLITVARISTGSGLSSSSYNGNGHCFFRVLVVPKLCCLEPGKE